MDETTCSNCGGPLERHEAKNGHWLSCYACMDNYLVDDDGNLLESYQNNKVITRGARQ